MLVQNFEIKINKKLRNILTNNFRKFDILTQIKFYLTITNNAYRQIKIENNSNISQKKNKTINKLYYNFNLIYICIIITIVKSTIIISIVTLFFLINTKNSKKNNCFICYTYEHLIRDCSNYNAKTTIIKKLQVNLFLNYNF